MAAAFNQQQETKPKKSKEYSALFTFIGHYIAFSFHFLFTSDCHFVSICFLLAHNKPQILTIFFSSSLVFLLSSIALLRLLSPFCVLFALFSVVILALNYLFINVLNNIGNTGGIQRGTGCCH